MLTGRPVGCAALSILHGRLEERGGVGDWREGVIGLLKRDGVGQLPAGVDGTP